MANTLSTKPTDNTTEDRKARIKAIAERGRAKARALPPRSPKEAWDEFDAAWNKIACHPLVDK